MFYVYHLIDPRTSVPFYVGKGKGSRASFHLHPNAGRYAPSKFTQNIITKIRREGLEPRIEFVGTGLSEEAAFALERSEILRFGKRVDGSGCLTNILDGGQGSSGAVFTIERRQRISLALTGKKLSEEHRQALSEGAHRRVRVPHTDATKSKMSEAKKGRAFSDEHRRKISEFQKARKRGPCSEETRTKISLAQKGRQYALGRVHSQETVNKISAALKGKKRGPIIGRVNGPMTDETKAKLSAALKGRPKPPFSEEHRRNISRASNQRGPISEETRDKLKKAQQARRKREKQNETI